MPAVSLGAMTTRRPVSASITVSEFTLLGLGRDH
jgi:hypothetical protein